jgi:hypothetical protein
MAGEQEKMTLRNCLPKPAEVFFLVSGLCELAYFVTRTDLGYWSLILPGLQFLSFGPILVLDSFGASPRSCKVVRTIVFFLSFMPVFFRELSWA